MEKKSVIFSLIIISLSPILASPVIKNEQYVESQETRDILADLIAGIIEGVRQGLIDANADPFPIPFIDLDLNSNLLKGKIQLSDAKISGITDFNVTKVAANIIALSVDVGLKFTEFEISGNYDVYATALNLLPIYGKGPFSIKVSEIEASGGGKLKASLVGGFLTITNLSYSLSIGDFNVNFEGLLGGGELGEVVNQIVNDLGLTVFNYIEAVAHDIIITVLTDVVNAVIGDWTLADIIGGGKKTTTTKTTTTEAPLIDARRYLTKMLI